MSPMGRKTFKKGSMVLYVLLLMAALVVMSWLRNSIETKRVEERRKTLVALEYAPMFLYTYSDTLGGFSYDLLRLVAKQGGIDLEFQPMVTLSTSLEKLKSGEYKMVCAEFPVTKDNKQEYLFTTPIYLDRQVLVQKKTANGDIAVKSQLELANDTVWVVKGSSSELRVKNLSHEIGDTIYVKAEPEYGAEQLIMRVLSGEIRLAVVNERIAKEFAKKNQSLEIAMPISMTQFQSWIINKTDSVFCDSINSWIEAVKQTPEYKTLHSRYFPD